MGKVIAKRFIFMIPVVLAVTFIIFMLSFISAGDAARVLAEKKYEHPSPEQVEEVRHEEGLDQPVLVQYGKWLDQALHGDFGKSYSTRKPAFEELKRYFPQTFKLAVTSFLLLKNSLFFHSLYCEQRLSCFDLSIGKKAYSLIILDLCAKNRRT